MSLDSDCEWCGPDCNGESHSKPWVPGDHLKWGTSALGGTARVTHVRYDGWIRVAWDCGRFDEQWHSPNGWAFATKPAAVISPRDGLPGVILGIQMEPWQVDPYGRLAVRIGGADGIMITHQIWDGDHALVVDWPGRRNGIGSGRHSSYEDALSQLRRALAHVGHNVFGGVPLPWEQP